jgi:RNA polymerase sigma-70 factor (ECF subfamily)
VIDIQRDILPLKNILYRLALRITLNSQEAEDVVQDVIIKMWKMGERLNDVENLESYALRLTRNLSIDRQRMKVNQVESFDELEDFHGGISNSIESRLEQQERIDSIRDIMMQMPEKQRSVMQLRDFEGKSYKEIALALEISEDQVKVNIFRARQFVKSRIAKAGDAI